jgi:hypothetical protein
VPDSPETPSFAVHLAISQRARRLTQAALHRTWSPVGAGVMPKAETVFLVRHLFSGEAGDRAIRRVDDEVHRLSGLAGLDLLARSGHRYGLGPKSESDVSITEGTSLRGHTRAVDTIPSVQP